MEKPKEYYAFISYKREDEKWAKWLQDKLEHYKFPTNLNGRTDLPKKIYPTFRDVTDLSPEPLEQAINNALCNSEWLIVVCSPRSARSPWVCKEAQTFIDHGRADHIIPFVIEGNPFSNDTATECYPKALLNLTGNKELLAANINEMGRDAAAIKVVARMFNLRFDALWQRYEREKKNKRRLILCFLSAIILIVVGIAYWMFLKNWATMKAQSRFVSEIANTLTDSGDSFTSIRLLVEILPNDLVYPNRPYTPQAEFAFRKAVESEYFKIVTKYPTHKVKCASNKRFVFFTNGWKVLLLDTKNGNILDPNWSHYSSVISIAVSKDNNYIASVSGDDPRFSDICDYSLKIWDLRTNALYSEINNLSSHINDISFCPNNNWIALASKDGNVSVWDINSKKKIRDILNYQGAIVAISYSNDGYWLIAASDDGKLFLHDIQSNTTKTINAHNVGISSVLFSPNGEKVISSSHDGTIKIWDTNTLDLISCITNKSIESGDIVGVNSASINQNGTKIAIASDVDNLVKVYNIETLELCEYTNKHDNEITSVCFANEGDLIITSSIDYTIRIGGTKHTNSKNSIKGHNSSVTSVSYSLDGNKIISASEDGCVKVWDNNLNKLLFSYKHGEPIQMACFSPDCNNILFASNNCTYVWNFKNNSIINRFKCSDIIYSVSNNKAGNKIVTASADDSITVWDAVNNTILYQMLELTPNVTSSSFSPDDERIAVTCYSTVHIWNSDLDEWWNDDLNQLWPIVVENGHRELTICSSFSPNSKDIVSGSKDGELIIWKVKTGRKLVKLNGKGFNHKSAINSVSYSQDGKYIVSASEDGRVNIWESNSGEIIRSYQFNTPVLCSSFSPNGKKIVIGLIDGIITIIDFPPLQELIDETRERFKDNPLTPEERRQYYLE